jgi:ABC-2 type transport system permease protein
LRGLAYLPAVWVVVGVVVAAFGLAPRAVAVGWLVLAYGVFVGLLGGVLDLPDVVRNLSPFDHVPQLSADTLAATPLVVLLTLAAALIAAGLAGLRHRDIEMN